MVATLKAAEVLANVASKNDKVDQWSDGVPVTILRKGKAERVPFSSLKILPTNPREKASVEKNAARLKAAFLRVGYDPTSVLSIDENGETLRGSSRLTALKSLTPEELATVLPDGVIPVIRFTGLTPWERQVIINDHGKEGDRQKLTRFELFNGVRGFVKCNDISVADIGAHYGFGRSWAQKMVALAKMPKEVQEAFRPVLENELTKTHLRMQDILFVARDYGNLNKADFAATWETWVAGTHPDGEAFKKSQSAANKTSGPQNVDLSKVRENVNAFDSETVKNVVNYCNAATFATTLDSQVASLERQLAEARELIGAINEKEMIAIRKRLAKVA